MHGKPGKVATFRLTLISGLAESEFFGFSTDWAHERFMCSVRSPGERIVPGEPATIDVEIKVPDGADAKPGDYPIRVTAFSRADPTTTASVECVLVVEEHKCLKLPTVKVSAEKDGRLNFDLGVLNCGNIDVSCHMSVEDKDGKVHFKIDPPVLTIHTGLKLVPVTVKLTPDKKGLHGTVTVKLLDENGDVLAEKNDVKFDVLPWKQVAAAVAGGLVVLFIVAGAANAAFGGGGDDDDVTPTASPVTFTPSGGSDSPTPTLTAHPAGPGGDSPIPTPSPTTAPSPTATLSPTPTPTPPPVNEAPTAKINGPQDGTEVCTDGKDAIGYYKLIALLGEANDPEDGPLRGDSLEWSDSLDGGDLIVIAHGVEQAVRLYAPSGDIDGHAIELKATDRDGLSDFREIKVIVKGPFNADCPG